MMKISCSDGLIFPGILHISVCLLYNSAIFHLTFPIPDGRRRPLKIAWWTKLPRRRVQAMNELVHARKLEMVSLLWCPYCRNLKSSSRLAPVQGMIHALCDHLIVKHGLSRMLLPRVGSGT
jgi:hypothetical protein